MIRGLIFAAGRGSRMKKKTFNKPKCLSLIGKKTLLDLNIQNFHNNKIFKISIVTGYKRELIPKIFFKKYFNKNWRKTSIVKSLMCADDLLKKHTTIISYSDIFYNHNAISILKNIKSDVSILYDPNWYKLWKKRFKNPLKDAETFNFDKKNYLQVIGDKTHSLEKIKGQYMGLFKITPRGWKKIKKHLTKYHKTNLEKMDITAFLKSYIKKNNKVKVAAYRYKWSEIDTPKDLKISQKIY